MTLAQHLEAALAAQGEPSLEHQRSIARIEAALGRAFAPAPAPLLARITRASEAVLEHVAFGRLGEAYALGEPTLAEIEASAVAIGRTSAASDALDLCLYLVRADASGPTPERALDRAERCVRLAPDLQPDARRHPARVLEIVSAVRRAADASGGVLSIAAEEGDPQGCAIRVNGRIIGHTPRARIALPAGDYGAQVECTEGSPGRVVPVTVDGTSPVRMNVHVRLGETLTASEPVLVLRLPPSEVAAAVGTLQRILEVDRVLVAISSAGALEVRAFEASGDRSARAVGSATVPRPLDAPASRAALDAARSGARGERESAGDPDTASVVTGASLLAVGVGAYAVGWYFWMETEARAREIDLAEAPQAFGQRQRDLDASLAPVLAVGATAAALATAGSVVLIAASTDRDVPWWSWVIGALGLATAGVGIGLAVSEGACHGNTIAMEPCARRTPMWLVGTLVLEHAAPLLAVPLTHLARTVTSSPATARVSLGGSGAVMEVGSAF